MNENDAKRKDIHERLAFAYILVMSLRRHASQLALRCNMLKTYRGLVGYSFKTR
jgi:hypothetical protein